MKFEFTPSQKTAIGARGGTVLVSAAAGSGKTRVLTQRLLEYVADPVHPVDVDRFLVITYTRAAAAELRSRILDALTALAAEHPGNRQLRRQQSLCCRAGIGTIHSYCAALLREYSQVLGISPAFSVLEEDRGQQLRQSVASRLLDKRYERIRDDADFRALVDTVGAGRDDRRLQEALLELYDKLRAHPYPDAWAAAQKAAMDVDGVTDAGETVWGREVLDAVRERARYWAGEMGRVAQDIRAADEKIRAAYEPSFQATAAALDALDRACAQGWDAALAAARQVEFPALKALRRYEDPAFAEDCKAVREKCKKACGALAEMFVRDSDGALADLRAAAPAMGALLDLALEFDEAYMAEKNRRGVLDFSDLEHLAVQLLVHRETGAPTWVAAEQAQRFAEVMVDEYQDVNAVQELIFRAVSRQGRNLFLVGDVKQSIYRFRLAEPELFLEKYAAFAPAEQAAEGAPRRVLLQENFRSRKSVLDAANLVMGTIMSRALGELDYDEDAALRCGADYDPAQDVPVQVHLMDPVGRGAEDGEDPDSAAMEARFIAGEILEMMAQGTPVTENGVTRRCDWGDFVLLLRSPGSKGSVFRRVLAQAGIPVAGRAGSGFFTSLEVAAVVDLLAVIDNPHADVPLISVLRSPLFGFTADQLSAVRVADRDSDFYGAVGAAAAAGDEKCAAFLSQLEQWRAQAPEIGLDALVWRLCTETGLLAVCAAMADGERRRRNLMLLMEYARLFSARGYRGVFRFVRYLTRLAQSGAEPESAGQERAVRILSIHKSKGLEFPFVFLCDLGHQFNRDDSRRAVLLHSRLGLGPKVVDPAGGVEYPTIARRAVARRQETEMLSEEMRVLYVGMTRARERLVCSGVWKGAAEDLEALRRTAGGPAAPERLRQAPNPLHWVAAAAVRDARVLPVTVHTAAAAPAAAASTAPAQPDGGAAPAMALEFVYPWAGAETLPSKLTASSLEGEDPDGEEAAETLVAPAPAWEFRPIAPGEVRLSPAERGTATHTFLQYVDFGAADLDAQLARLTAQGRLSAAEAGAIDLGSVARLLASPLGRRMAAAEDLRREFRFLLLEPAADYYGPAGGQDELLVQGVVDCCFVEDGGITVVDYKTDRVTAAQAPARAETYRAQLDVYARALERIFGLPVRQRVLWFLTPGTAVEV